jgi:hypothetical protein
MTLYEFIILSFEYKYKAVFEHAVFLDNYINKNKSVKLGCTR